MTVVLAQHDTVEMTEGEIRALVTEAAASVKLVPGRPSDTFHDAARNWGMRAIIPRQNVLSYRVRPGRDTLETLRLVIDRDPDASKAMTNFLLLMGQGYEKIASSSVDAEGNPVLDAAAQAYLTDFDTRIGEEYGGGMDALINVLNRSNIWQGAVAAELELSDDLREVLDVHPYSPDRVSFKRDPQTHRLRRGTFGTAVGTPGRDSDGFVEFPPRQFRYIPFHPNVGEPYGSPPLLAALSAIFFKVELLEDLKAVVHNQGHARLDISVTLDSIMANLPKRLREKGNDAELRAFVNGFLKDVKSAFDALNPDDSFIHPDNVKSQYVGPTGGVDFKSLSEIIDNQIIAGVKQLPIMLGRNEGATTTHATIQWQIQALEIAAFQHITKRMIEWIHNSALAIAGFAARSTVTFAALRTAERLAEAQAIGQEITNWSAMEDRGYVNQDEAAMNLTGHKAVGPAKTVPATVPATTTAADAAAGGSPASGTNSQPNTQRGGDHHGDQGTGGLAVNRARTVETPGARTEFRSQSGELSEYRAGDGPDDGRLRLDHADRGADRVQSRSGTGSGERHNDPGGQNPGIVGPGAVVVLPSGARLEVFERTNLVRSDTDATTPQTSVASVYAARLATAQGDLDTLTATITPSISDQFAELATLFPSDDVAAGKITPAEFFASSDAAAWSAKLRTILTDHYKRVWDVRGQSVLDELGLEGVFSLENPDALQALEDFGLARVSGMDDVTLSTTLDILRAGIDNGDHPFDIADALRAALSGMSGARAETIARTETAHAYSYAALESYRRNGVKYKVWLTAEDDKVDAPCPDYADQGRIGIAELFGGVDAHPPAHPNCRCALVADLTDAADVEPWTGA